MKIYLKCMRDKQKANLRHNSKMINNTMQEGIKVRTLNKIITNLIIRQKNVLSNGRSQDLHHMIKPVMMSSWEPGITRLSINMLTLHKINSRRLNRIKILSNHLMQKVIFLMLERKEFTLMFHNSRIVGRKTLKVTIIALDSGTIQNFWRSSQTDHLERSF